MGFRSIQSIAGRVTLPLQALKCMYNTNCIDGVPNVTSGQPRSSEVLLRGCLWAFGSAHRFFAPPPPLGFWICAVSSRYNRSTRDVTVAPHFNYQQDGRLC